MGEHNSVADEVPIADDILILNVGPMGDELTVPSSHEFRTRDRRDNPSSHMRPTITTSRVVQLENPPDIEHSKNDRSHATVDKCLKRFHGSPCAAGRYIRIYLKDIRSGQAELVGMAEAAVAHHALKRFRVTVLRCRFLIGSSPVLERRRIAFHPRLKLRDLGLH